MFQFVYILRALAAVLITNAHYEEIYPVSIIANGGLLGDVIFFGVSGFLLYPVKKPFTQWYIHRLLRIYPSVWIITIIYLCFGFYQAPYIQNFFALLFYPTYYHFIASIIVLYIPFYFISWLSTQNVRHAQAILGSIGLLLGSVYFGIYIGVYDYSYYHIDNVYSPMIWFLFFFSMLIGAYYRIQFHNRTANGEIPIYWKCIAFILSSILYFISKLMFANNFLPSSLQLTNQLILLSVLFFLFSFVISLEQYLISLPTFLKQVIRHLSERTLEIYLVQYALIPRLNIGPFPWNFFLVSIAILLSAELLHSITNRLRKYFRIINIE